ncbi:ligase [archaeon]|nr:ligase [archaeon]
MDNETWRVVKLEQRNGFENMALDQAISEDISKGTSPPTIRFYEWEPSAVTIGYFQSLKQEVDVENCLKQGVDIIRRITGGGAVYHDTRGEITYSVIAREGMFPSDLTETYKRIGDWIIDSLDELGIVSQFHPINDIIAYGKKISGNAQTRRNGVMHQHGTILYDVDVEKMFSLLKVDDIKILDKIITSVKDRVTSVQHISQKSKPELADALVHGFTQNKQYEFGTWTPHELERMNELVETKYSTREWNYWR